MTLFAKETVFISPNIASVTRLLDAYFRMSQRAAAIQTKLSMMQSPTRELRQRRAVEFHHFFEERRNLGTVSVDLSETLNDNSAKRFVFWLRPFQEKGKIGRAHVCTPV